MIAALLMVRPRLQQASLVCLLVQTCLYLGLMIILVVVGQMNCCVLWSNLGVSARFYYDPLAETTRHSKAFCLFMIAKPAWPIIECSIWEQLQVLCGSSRGTSLTFRSPLSLLQSLSNNIWCFRVVFARVYLVVSKKSTSQID